jgi:hypothetical protein
VNSHNNGGANASGTYPVGKTVVIFTATDTCGNVAMDSTCVTVEDREAPMIVCPQDMTFDCGVDIDTLDFGVVTAMDICSDVTIEEDTVYNLNPCSVGTIIRTITVRDTSGNDTSCVQTITIDIENAFDSSRISLAQDSIFFGACDSIDLSRGGEPTLDLVGLSCFAIGVTSSDSMYTDTCDGEPCGIIERTWTVTDTCQLDGMGGGVWTVQQYFVIRGGMLQVFCPPDTIVDCTADLTDLSVFGDFDFTSPCGIDTVIRDSMIMLNECDLGMIFRSITVRDTAGNEATCQQKITVEDANPFTEANIRWPEDTLMLDGCGSLDPDSLLSRPIIDTSAAVCYDISVSFMDSVSSSCLQTPCVLVLRTWTVVDSCALDSMGNGLYTFTQRIEVNDTVAPVFNVSGIDTTIILDPDSCDFFVGNLVVSATDCADSITITNNSPFADAGGADASGMYPIGVTNFYFFAEDPCCNIDSIPVRVELLDTVQVTLNCTKVIKEIRDSLATVKFFVDEGTVVPATCRDLRLSFSLTDPNDTCRIYNCDSVRSRGTPAPIWAWKIYLFEDDVLIDSCDILHQVVEINRVCFGGSLGATVSGLIQTNRYSPVREAQVHLEGGGLPDKMTDEYGVYQFEPMPLGGKYLVEPGKNDDPLNGVTTKDLILIQRHLLGIRPFNNPYDFIAADINKSDEITAGDIIMLRRLLLGYYTAFPENTSWRFVDEGYSFPDPLDPWLEVFPETYEIDPLEQHMNVNFVGVKIGDVSGDVGLEGDISTRDSERFLIELEEREGHIHFYKAEGLSFDGVQFTLEWTPSDEEFELVFDENTVMGDEHFGFHSVDEGVLTVVLDEEMSQDRMYMFSLPKAMVQGEMRITSRVTRSMAITKDLGSVDVAWADKAVQEDTPSFTLYQNRPNPFKEGTVIGFDLPEDQEARLTILNVSGQIVHMVEGQFERGYNEIEIRTEDLLESGVYYYRLDCAGSSQTLKMINID